MEEASYVLVVCVHMSPLDLAALELQLASIAGECDRCDRHCAVLQDDLLNALRIDLW